MNRILSVALLLAGVAALVEAGDTESVAPNEVARYVVKRDLRQFAITYQQLMSLFENNKVVVDLMMVYVPGNENTIDYKRSHVLDSGKTVRETIYSLNQQFGDVIQGNHIIEVFARDSVWLRRISEMENELAEYELKPADVVIIRNASDI